MTPFMTPFLQVVVALIAVVVVAWLINARIRMPENFRLMSNVVLTLLVVGMILWLINNFVPMAGSILAILNIVVVVGTCVWVLKAFGIWSSVVRTWDNLIHRARSEGNPPHDSPLVTGH